MLTIFSLTAATIIVYLLYPFWLILQTKMSVNRAEGKAVESVSLIYLSQNGVNNLKNKIEFLLQELSEFKEYELIIIDDNSVDNTQNVLQNLNNQKMQVILQNERRGIPYNMNLGVKIAKYNCIVFCDQRQNLEKGIIKKLVAPLSVEQIGAVSACISSVDKLNCFSLLRAHENFIKQLESKTGSLIGVYGPLYALKKQYYINIPDKVILDDLYLTLGILNNKKVIFQKECKIADDNADKLYNYKRAKRYLSGFIQILTTKDLLRNLTYRQQIMLFWHKYLRLFIPVLLFLNYVMIAVNSFYDSTYRLLFILTTSLILLLGCVKLVRPNIVKINLYYFIAILHFGILKMFGSENNLRTTKREFKNKQKYENFTHR